MTSSIRYTATSLQEVAAIFREHANRENRAAASPRISEARRKLHAREAYTWNAAANILEATTIVPEQPQ